MMTIMPMPCCGQEVPEHTSEVTYSCLPGFEVKADESINGPEEEERGVINAEISVQGQATITETTDWSSFGWDPKTDLCRACGAPHSDYQCGSLTCNSSIAKEDRFCGSCLGAYAVALADVDANIGPGGVVSVDILGALRAEEGSPLREGLKVCQVRRPPLEQLLMAKANLTEKVLQSSERAREVDAVRLKEMGLKP